MVGRCRGRALKGHRCAFGPRAIIEQAKGILMERNGIDAEAAFALLTSHSQQTGQKLSEVARALTQTHLLLAEREPGKGQSE